MTQLDPSARPDATAALQQWQRIRHRMLAPRYGWRLRDRKENIVGSIVLDLVSLLKMSKLLSRRLSAFMAH